MNRQAETLEEVFREVRRLFHRLRATAEEAHGDIAITAAMRGVMESLGLQGAQTVPQLARARPVSRQHIQTIVNALVERSLVEAVENPAHRRSSLIRLTGSGKKRIRAMRERENRLLARIDPRWSDRDLNTTLRTLQSIRGLLEGKEWRRSVRTIRQATSQRRKR